MSTTYTSADYTLIADDPAERLRQRLHALESANVSLCHALRLALVYIELGRPQHAGEPLCDSDGCIRCCEVHQWQKTLIVARQALGEEVAG